MSHTDDPSQPQAEARAPGAAAHGGDDLPNYEFDPFFPAKNADRHNPMITWLRGDEPTVEEFTLDADAVMAQLGIKRSRLTQISGTDLKVGRMRIGRYIRPVYRQADVDEYKAWTRRSASHKKSADVLKDAAKEVQAATQSWQQLSQQLLAELDQSLGRPLRQLERSVRKPPPPPAGAAEGLDPEEQRWWFRQTQTLLQQTQTSLVDLAAGQTTADDRQRELFGELSTALGERLASLSAVVADHLDRLHVWTGRQDHRMIALRQALDRLEDQVAIMAAATQTMARRADVDTPKVRPQQATSDGRRLGKLAKRQARPSSNASITQSQRSRAHRTSFRGRSS